MKRCGRRRRNKEIFMADRFRKIKDVLRPWIPGEIIELRNRARTSMRLERAASMHYMPFEPGKFPMGINLYGDAHANTGLGKNVRILIGEFQAAGIPFRLIPIDERDGSLIREEPEGTKEEEDITYSVNVFNIQPPVWECLRRQLPDEALDGHYNIAHWSWETPHMPEEWRPAVDCFDEFWAPSVFIARAIRRFTQKPIRVFHYGIWTKDCESLLLEEERHRGRKKYGIPREAFMVLLMYDARSNVERKNPEASIKAMKKAFGEDSENVCFLIKAKSMDVRERNALKRMCEGLENLCIVEEHLSDEDTQEMIASADVLLSLHRAEGFGLVVAEAMKCGVVPVATDYSATREFMDQSCGCPVQYRLVCTGRTYGVYAKGTIWAEPDVTDAAEKLRRMYDDLGLRQELAAAGRERIRCQLDEEKIGKKIFHRIKNIEKLSL